MIKSLWEFSLLFYEMPKMAQACLSLQDHCDADVNLILLSFWLATNAQKFDNMTLAFARGKIESWQQTIIKPLRRVRQNLKFYDGACLSEELYMQIKGIELEAERQEQKALVCCPFLPSPDCLPYNLARQNLECYLDNLAARPSSGETETLLEAFQSILDRDGNALVS